MATLNAMFKLFDGYSSTADKVIRKTDQTTDKILKASGQTDKFNQKLEQTGASANIGSSGLGKFLSITAAIAGAVKGMSIADEYMNTSSRLNLINDGLQTQAELQDKIFASANRAKGAYGDMADAVAKIGLLAGVGKGKLFGSNDELIAFTELVQKSFKVGGADTSEQQGAMRQLSQAMASGRLQGDELVSIMENAPMIYDAIAKYTGLTKGQLKEVSSEGAITADIIKNAMFAAGDDINGKFKTMPTTFGDVWNRIKNGGLQAFDKVIRKVNQLINTKKFDKFIDDLIRGFNIASSVISWLIDVIVNGWDVIKPILVIITTVYLVTMIAKLWAMIPPLIAQAAAWLAVYWPVVLVVGIIAAAIWILREFGVTWDEIFSGAGGTVGIFAAFAVNKFAYIWNQVAAFINFFGNVFNGPIASIKMLFLDLAITVLGYMNTMSQGIEDAVNKIPGVKVDVARGTDNLLKKIQNDKAKLGAESGWKEYAKTIEYMDYSDSYKKGSKAGSNVVDVIDKAVKDFKDTVKNDAFDPSKFLGAPIEVKGTGKNGAVEVDMADEDLQYLRDIAEREYINKFSSATLAPNISIKFGDVTKEADADKVAGRIKKILQEEIILAAEGV